MAEAPEVVDPVLPEMDLMYMAESIEQAIIKDWLMFDLTPEILEIYRQITVATISETPATIAARGKAVNEASKGVERAIPSIKDLILG